jgi:hypothetical protein
MLLYFYIATFLSWAEWHYRNQTLMWTDKHNYDYIIYDKQHNLTYVKCEHRMGTFIILW